MIEVIPAINAKTFSTARSRIRAVESYVPWVQIDVSDSVFTPYESWRTPEEWGNFSPSCLIELHLMVQNPLKTLPAWLKHVKPQRIIAHVESFVGQVSRGRPEAAISNFIAKLRKQHISVGLAIKPDTPVDALRLWLGQIDLAQVLAVEPGPSGQQFQSSRTMDKIRQLEKLAPFRIIEVDGGITPEIARRCAEAGADAVVAGEFIFGGGAEETGAQIDKLRAATYGVWRP